MLTEAVATYLAAWLDRNPTLVEGALGLKWLRTQLRIVLERTIVLPVMQDLISLHALPLFHGLKVSLPRLLYAIMLLLNKLFLVLLQVLGWI